MFLFMILLLISLILIGVVVAVLSVFGAGAILIFGDVIICVLLIGWIMKKIFFNKKKKK